MPRPTTHDYASFYHNYIMNVQEDDVRIAFQQQVTLDLGFFRRRNWNVQLQVQRGDVHQHVGVDHHSHHSAIPGHLHQGVRIEFRIAGPF